MLIAFSTRYLACLSSMIRTHAAEAPAVVSYAGSRKDSSSSRSAGSTPHAVEAYRARGNFPFDSSAAFKQQRRQRLPHNASAHELG